MSRGGNEELQELLETIDMESWLDREGIRYRVTRGARGTQLNVKECPCCGDSDYKVYINADTGLGNCFHGSCETKFNKWKFIRAHLGRLSNREVVEHIKQIAKEQGWQPPRKKGMAVNLRTDLVLPDSVPLPINGRNLKYLENRNITSDIARYFNLRFSMNGVFRYTDEEGRKRVQDYSKRIIIPVFDLVGDLVSFQGRDITGTAERKYLFPPGYSSTGTILYNGQNAHGATRVCVGEGVFDVAATKIALDGDMNLRDVAPVGTFGKHLSFGDDQSQLAKFVKLMEDGLKQVTFMWDAEPDAIEAAIEAALMLRGVGLQARIALLPAGCDPNEVPPSVVRAAFWRAETVTPTVAARMRIARRIA